MRALLQALGNIGNTPSDSDEERLRKQLLIYMATLMSMGGLTWGSIAASLGLTWPALVPFGYVVLTGLNLSYLGLSKDFTRARLFQVTISLLLPLAFQISLGGFVQSGAVMLWSMLAIVGALTFSSTREALRWLLLYLVFTVIIGLLDPWVRGFQPLELNENQITAFFLVNIVANSAIVFGLTIYLNMRRDRALAALTEANVTITVLNEALEVDIAARTRQLREGLAEREAILANIADGLVAVDKAGVVRVANPAFMSLFELSGTIEGQQILDALPPALASVIETTEATLGSVEREFPLPNDRIGQVNAAAMSSDGQWNGSVALIRDVTLEREIDRMKTDFIATVSHELRTPLTSVLGFAKITQSRLRDVLLKNIPEGDPKVARAARQVTGNIDIIVSEGHRLTALINDVLDISKMEAGHMEWRMAAIEPAALVRDAASAVRGLFPPDGQITLVEDIQPELATIEGDRDRLQQVLINLLSNAAKFTDKGTVTISAYQTTGGVGISVKDTGEGIDPSQQSAIFEKFRQVGDTLTSKPQGTGLGLPICRQIVQAHGSELELTSALGKGATFSFELSTPYATSLTTGDLAPRLTELMDSFELTLEDKTDEHGQTILVVDDDENLREYMRQQLSEDGYNVLLASTGYEAIHKVRQDKPDLILMDVIMPQLSGFDVAAMLKSDAATRDIPILVISIVQDEDRGRKLGVEGYLKKPVEPAELLRAVRRLLKRAQTGRRLLIVRDEGGTGEQQVAALLSGYGCEVVETCSRDEALQIAAGLFPDMVLIENRDRPAGELVHALRQLPELSGAFIATVIEEKATSSSDEPDRPSPVAPQTG